ncbi:MAG: hypothetical protein ACI9XP_000356 [Lentimonas sp.]|jgi:hypothetical protein
MNTKTRISSILNTSTLDSSITGFPNFSLSELEVVKDLEFELPTNIRLGQLVEKIVSELIKSSKNYNLQFENIQIIENKKTIGEIDFIIEKTNTNEQIHLELAYKFYLFDPSISSVHINNWIGPNRNDSLREKLDKLKSKQFPLLYDENTISFLNKVDMNKVSQKLCLLASLFIPYDNKTKLNSAYQNAIKGYYLSFDLFKKLDNSEKSYFLPTKKEWGMDPSKSENWTDYHGVENQISINMEEKQAPMVWQKFNDEYLVFFIVWW